MGCGMKKITALVLALVLCLFSLCSCGKTKIRMEGKTFAFAHARVDSEVRACSASLADTYKDARVMEYTLSASGGKLTVTGEGGTYTGEYKVYKLFEDSALYEINIGVEPGFASLSQKVYDDGTAEFTLILTIRGYFVTFTTERTAME